jgi:hypothetical protein
MVSTVTIVQFGFKIPEMGHGEGMDAIEPAGEIPLRDSIVRNQLTESIIVKRKLLKAIKAELKF